MTIIVIRHGETEGNASGIIQMPQIALNERGIDQAQRLAARLADYPIERLLVSDYQRTQMTAAPLAKARGIEIELEPLLRERHFGALRGRRAKEIGSLFDPQLEVPEGESWAVFEQRVANAWQSVCERAERTHGTLAVVTHGMVCYAFLQRHWQHDLSPQAAEAFRFSNTSVTIVSRERPHRIERLGCCEHLDAPSASIESV